MLLMAALLAAGCTTFNAPGADVEPAAATPTPDPTPEPTPTSAEDDDGASEPEDEPAPSTPPAQPTSEPDDDAGDANATRPDEPGPAFTPPTPYNITGDVKLGYLAGAGTGGETEGARQTDATYCSDAVFGVPTGATRLHVQVLAAEAATAAPSAGQYALIITAPDGTTTKLQPVLENVPGPDGTTPNHHEATFDAPIGGGWKLHVEPIGPVVTQLWTFGVSVSGTSFDAPGPLGLVHACGAAYAQ